jgi:FecR protein
MKVHAATFALGLIASLYSVSALAVPAGKVLFAQPGAEIVNEKGEKRPAKRGDQLESGERLLTPAGAITQVLLPDGSLVGMRPGSELKLELPPQASEKAGQVLSLLQGSLRLIGSDLMDAKKLSALTLQTGNATLRLAGADLESALVKPTDLKTAGTPEIGSYSRLLTGTGSIGSGALVEPLAPREVSFVGMANVAPIKVASVSPTLFTSVSPAIATSGSVLPTKTLAPTTVVQGTDLKSLSPSPVGGGSLQPMGVVPLKTPVAVAPTTLPTLSPVVVPTNLPLIKVAPAPVIQPILTIKPVNPPVSTPKTCAIVTIKGKNNCV